jgi:hypothetical protein
MPLTFPSHAAAILPLLHLAGTRRLPASALVVGSTAPDLMYLICKRGEDGHRPPGLLWFCLPAGLVAFLYLEALLLPVVGPRVLPLLPAAWQRSGARLLGPRALPDKPSGWLAVGVAVLLGAASHQLWDGFTHAWMWPARDLYPGVHVALLGHRVLVSKLLQHLSSVVGAGVVLLYVYWMTRHRPERPPLCPEFQPGSHERVGAALWRLVGWPLGGAMLAAAVQLWHREPLLSKAIWDAAWAAMAWFVLLLGCACLLQRIRKAS